VAGNVGLLHTRLAIIDLEGGAQPLYNEDRSLILVANGEIYNYRELRSELETLGHRFATHSDCETILHGYEAWGITFLDRLQGMFAFALHDVQRGELILARDRLGIKPLYYCRNSRGLAFASEIKALQPWLGKPEVDPQGLAQLLQSNFTCAPRTLLQGVAKLPPAHLARIDTRTLTIELHAYW
jgi:asparagine synthase (glutamine-hydrolysing)